MTERIQVALGSRSYDIIVGSALLAEAGHYIAPLLGSDTVFIVSDDTVAVHYLNTLVAALEKQGVTCHSLVLPPGEASKSFEMFGTLLSDMLEKQPDRSTAVIALGGGVVGDIAGFAASVLLRGVDFIQIPTTLLAQVDSAVGGKNGVNAPQGKNLIGTFHQPRLVLADIDTLASLPEREKRAGYAEIVKYGLINDAAFFNWLEDNGDQVLAGETACTTHAIAQSCYAKAAIVAADEHEAGTRALLNFGHTFAHALEAECGYNNELLHGEAVAIGMALAFQLSVAMELCPAGECARAAAHLEHAGLPVSPLAIRPQWDIDRLLRHMLQDKKARGGSLTLILTHGIGKAFVARDVEKELVRQALVEATTGV